MLRKLAAALLCTAAPVALFAEPVELRSTDGFISVEGEVVGFNGTMISVETSVGRVSVPAAAVVCFGAGCVSLLTSNDFGLTASAFESTDTPIAAPEPVIAQETGGSDDFFISFGAPVFDTIYRSIVGAYMMTATADATISVGATGEIGLANAATSEVAKLRVADAGNASDAVLGTASLRGTAAESYANATQWATATAMPAQMLGLRGFAVVVAADVGLDAISMQQLADIYAGEVTNWSALGGADLKILPLKLPPSSPINAEIVDLVMAPVGKTMAANVLTMSDEISIAQSIPQFPGSISIIGTEDAADNTVLAVSGTCGVAVLPTDFNMNSGDYPLVRPLIVRFDQTPQTSLLTRVFDYATNDIVQASIAAEGFSDLTAIALDESAKNGRLNQLLSGDFDEAQRVDAAQMFQHLFAAERLSPTMIGGAVSANEGAWNRAMFATLAAALADPAMSGREVMFVGFSDTANPPSDPTAVSAAAAADMMDAFSRYAPSVATAANLTLSSHGYGGISPATCAEGQVDGADHTRVEIWVQ